MKQRPYRIDQLLPSYAPFDAVGNHVSLIRGMLQKRGFESDIFCEMSHGQTAHNARHYKEYDPYATRDVIGIYHFSIGSILSRYFYGKPCFHVCSYHNITPHQYFANWDFPSFSACLRGRNEFPLLRNYVDMTWSVSQFNQDELIAQGLSGPHLKFPVLRDYERLSKLSGESDLSAKLKSRKNILFVGRITPHKSQFDMIFMAHVLKQKLQRNYRLIIAGSGQAEFVAGLVEKARELGLKVSQGSGEDLDCDVWFTQHISDDQLAQIYRSSDLFLCLSEHEGFCVPLVEAMFFGVPIIAHQSSAIPETLGSGGLLINKFDLAETLSQIVRSIEDNEYGESLRIRAKQRANDFSWSKLEEAFDQVLEKTLIRYHGWYAGKPANFVF
jgi:glycosyltransferase involved in cell wall biosynthesis